MHNVLLFERPTRTEAFIGNYTEVARGWQRSSQAVGGYWLGSFSLSSEDVNRNELVDFYSRNLGCIVREYCAGLLSWEGYILEMRLSLDGAEYMNSLRSQWFHNKVKSIYASVEVQSQDELIGNVGFETAGGGGADIWADWSEDVDTGGALTDETVLVNSGSHACKITAGTGRDDSTKVYQDWSVTEGHIYEVSFYTRGDGTRTGRYRIKDMTNNTDILPTRETGVEGEAYVFVSVRFTVPAGCTTARLLLRSPGFEANGHSAYFDDVSVRGILIAEGSQQDTGWSENTDSSAEYGEMEYILTLPRTTDEAASALRDRHLLTYGWPRSRLVSRLAFGQERKRADEDKLLVVVAGFWHTLNQRHRETSVEDMASQAVDTLVRNSEFVSVGRIEENQLPVFCDCESAPQMLGDAIADIIEQGGEGPTVWQGGVYGGRRFVYEEAPTEPTYTLQRGELLDAVGVAVLPPLLEPGFLVEIAGAPVAIQPPGTSSIWDDPRICYVDQVEYIAPDGLRLQLYGEDATIELLSTWMRRKSGPSVSG